MFTTGAGLMAEGASTPRALVGGAAAFLAVTALAAWVLRAAGADAEEIAHGARLEKVRVERDFVKLKAGLEEARKRQLEVSSLVAGLHTIAAAAAETQHVAHALELVVDIMQKQVGARRCSVWLTGAEKQLTLEHCAGWSEAERAAAKVEVGRGPIGRAVAQQVTLDCETMKRDPQTMMLPRESKTPTMICAPVMMGGEVLGALNVEEFTDSHRTNLVEDVRVMQFLGTLAAMALKNARVFEEVADRAITDGLTRLHNHRHFQDQLDREVRRAERYGGCCSVILTDIDHFKKFNDTYGHQIGDLVLRETATCIKGAGLDRESTLARYGGEEFVVVLPQVAKGDAAVVAEHLRRSVEGRAVRTDAGELKVTISLGVATYPEDAQAKAQLIEMADQALYRAKKAGRNRVHLAGVE